MNNRFIQEIQIHWDQIQPYSYLQGIPALRSIDRLAFPNNITFFVGENGTGKSTLLEAIAVGYGFNPEGGTLNYRFSTYDDVSELSSALSPAPANAVDSNCEDGQTGLPVSDCYSLSDSAGNSRRRNSLL